MTLYKIKRFYCWLRLFFAKKVQCQCCKKYKKPDNWFIVNLRICYDCY